MRGYYIFSREVSEDSQYEFSLEVSEDSLLAAKEFAVGKISREYAEDLIARDWVIVDCDCDYCKCQGWATRPRKYTLPSETVIEIDLGWWDGPG